MRWGRTVSTKRVVPLLCPVVPLVCPLPHCRASSSRDSFLFAGLLPRRAHKAYPHELNERNESTHSRFEPRRLMGHLRAPQPGPERWWGT